MNLIFKDIFTNFFWHDESKSSGFVLKSRICRGYKYLAGLKTNVMRSFLKWRNDFIINNPKTTAWIGFAKGIVLTVIVYEFLLS